MQAFLHLAMRAVLMLLTHSPNNSLAATHQETSSDTRMSFCFLRGTVSGSSPGGLRKVQVISKGNTNPLRYLNSTGLKIMNLKKKVMLYARIHGHIPLLLFCCLKIKQQKLRQPSHTTGVMNIDSRSEWFVSSLQLECYSSGLFRKYQ